MKQRDFDEYLEDLEELVNVDSFTGDTRGLNAMAGILADKYERAGLFTHVEYQGDRGLAHVTASTADPETLPKDVEKPYDVMFVGHFDTVFEPGTAAERPFSIEGDRAMGPGVADMKGGLLLAFYLTMELKERYPDMNILIVNNGDEEGGSPASGRSLTDISKKARYAFVMEPGRINGGFVRSRKGVEEIRIRFRGKAAHAGIEPEKGVNAITEAAMWIPKLHKLNDPEKGITLNVDVIRGGTVSNVIAEECELVFDSRFLTREDKDRIEDGVFDLMDNPFDSRVSTEFIKLSEFPPMVMTEQSAEMIRVIEEESKKLGYDPIFLDVAGASDASLVSSAGTPVIDACGPWGDGFHTENEYILIHTVRERFDVLIAAIERLTGKIAD